MALTVPPSTLRTAQQSALTSPVSPATTASLSQPATAGDSFENIIASGGILPAQQASASSGSSGSSGDSKDAMKKMMESFMMSNMQSILQGIQDQAKKDAEQYPAV